MASAATPIPPAESPKFMSRGISGPSQAAQFGKSKLDRSELDASPFVQFRQWFETAREQDIKQCEGCTLSTASLPSGRISARIVYLKDIDDKGFVIYSNWGTSIKSQDVQSNPHAALTFWWRDLERQVRVEGTTERLSTEESQLYFDTRIRGSKIGAWASKQSSPLPDNREELDRQVDDVEQRFKGQDDIPVPPFWGGLRITPYAVEFHQGRENRLHDRFRYLRNEAHDGGEWKIQRLSP